MSAAMGDKVRIAQMTRFIRRELCAAKMSHHHPDFQRV